MVHRCQLQATAYIKARHVTHDAFRTSWSAGGCTAFQHEPTWQMAKDFSRHVQVIKDPTLPYPALPDEACLRAGTNLGYTGLFVKYGQPPGWRYGQWDFRPEWDYYSERDSDLEVRFDATHNAWQTGVPILRECLPLTACLPLCPYPTSQPWLSETPGGFSLRGPQECNNSLLLCPA